jgi:adenosylcobinamide-GDP ribazoletransferase
MDTPPQPQPQRSNLLADLVEAIRFLTIIPIPGTPTNASSSLAKAITFFPLVGLLLGVLLALVGLATGWFWGNSVRAVAIVVAGGALTAGLHLDGLADTFDGVMSWRPRERKLEIMRDSRIGVMGALALIAVFGLKVALLSTARAWVPALLLAPTLGRWAMSYALCRYPAARADGLGAAAQMHSGPAALRNATLIALAAALLIAGLRGVIACALVWLVTRTLARWWTRDLGGLTGDTYGALCEIGEVVVLAALTARL